MAIKNSLKSKHENIAQEWSTKNDVGPEDVRTSDNTPRYWECSLGHIWVTSPNQRVYKGRKCEQCPRKPVNTYAPERAKQWSPRNPLGPEHYGTGSKEKVWWKNDSCGHEWEQVVAQRVKGADCPVCSGHIFSKGHNDLLTCRPDVAASWSANNTLHPDEVMVNSNIKVAWTCLEDPHHGDWIAVVSARTSKGTGCPKCSGRRAVKGVTDLETTHPELKKLWSRDNTIRMSDVTYGSSLKVSWECEEGHTWSASVSNVARNGSRCPVCDGKVVVPGFNDIATTHPELAAQWHPDNDESPFEVSAGARILIKWQCGANPKHTWHAHPFNRANLKNPTGCPECNSSRMVSAQETELYEFVINELGSDVEVHQTYRKIPNVHELDIYIPSLNIAFEYNGIYWHSDKAGKDKGYHLRKRLACESQGIRLVTIWEDDWRDRQEIVKNMIRSRLGTYRGDKHNARALTWRKVPPAESQAFLNDNHIQGSSLCNRYDGLYTKTGVLVAVMATTMSGDVYTIDRYATNGNVRGGFSKLLRVLEQRIRFDGGGEIRTFADLMISNGDLYVFNEFIADKEMPPTYWVVDRDTRHSVLSFRKSRFRNDPTLQWEDGMSIHQLLELNNLAKIYDAGKIRFIKQITC